MLDSFETPYDRELPKQNSGNQIVFAKCPKIFKVDFGEVKVYFGSLLWGYSV